MDRWHSLRVPNSLSFLPDNVVIRLNETELVDFANHTTILAERNKEDSSVKYNASGDAMLSINHDHSGVVSLTLQATSASAALLSAAITSRKGQVLTIHDRSTNKQRVRAEVFRVEFTGAAVATTAWRFQASRLELDPDPNPNV
jgi:hypothetical protein